MKATVEDLKFDFEFSFKNPDVVNVYKNPTYNQMSNVKIKSSYGEIKGLLVGNTSVYIWKADLAKHADVIKELEADVNMQLEPDQRTFVPFLVNSTDQLKSFDPAVTVEQLMKHPLIKLMITYKRA